MQQSSEEHLRNFHMIYSVTTSNGMGYQNTKPWYIPDNIKFFKDITRNYKM